MLSVRGTVEVPGRLISWRGAPLRYDAEMQVLRSDVPALCRGEVKMSLDGYTPVALENVRIAMTTAWRFGTGQYGYMLLDSRTGMSVAARGFSGLSLESSQWGPTVQLGQIGYGWYSHGYTQELGIVFGRHGYAQGYLRTLSSLSNGELVLDALRPGSLRRRVRRFLRSGAVDIGEGILMRKVDTPAQWPPVERERKPRARSGEGLWHRSNPDRPRYC